MPFDHQRERGLLQQSAARCSLLLLLGLTFLGVGCGKKLEAPVSGPVAAAPTDKEISPPDGDGTSVTLRPKKELPKELFDYVPGDEYRVSYSDFETAAAGGEPLRLLDFYGAKILGITDKLVRQDVLCTIDGAPGPGAIDVHAYALKSPFDLRAAATAAKFVPLGPEGKVFQGTTQVLDNFRAFQPAPQVVVVLYRSGGFGTDTKLADELARRKPGDGRLSDARWAMMQELSGYASVSSYPFRLSDGVPSIYHKFLTYGASGQAPAREEVQMWTFTTADEAHKAKAEHVKRREDIAKKTPTAKTDSPEDVRFGVNGNQLVQLTLRTKKESK